MGDIVGSTVRKIDGEIVGIVLGSRLGKTVGVIVFVGFGVADVFNKLGAGVSFAVGKNVFILNIDIVGTRVGGILL